MGLNTNYINIRGEIMRMKPRPNLEMAYSIVLMEEQQRGNVTKTNDGVVLVAQQSQKQYSKEKKPLNKRNGKQKRNVTIVRR